jgi:hypothetical protein
MIGIQILTGGAVAEHQFGIVIHPFGQGQHGLIGDIVHQQDLFVGLKALLEYQIVQLLLIDAE